MNRFQRAREMAGYTQKELSAKIGVKPPIISRYEDEGEKQIVPPLARIMAISEACGVSMSFLTDTSPLTPLNDEQARRFKEELMRYNKTFMSWPEEVAASYGTQHPFLYMLKDRWKPTLEDLQYISRRFGIDTLHILKTELPSSSVIRSALETSGGDVGSKKIVEVLDTPDTLAKYLEERGLSQYHISLEDAESLILCGVKILVSDEGKELYLKIDDLDLESIEAIVTLSRKNSFTYRAHEHKEWEKPLSEEQ